MIRSIMTENFIFPGYREYELPKGANKFVCVGGDKCEAEFILYAICFCLTGSIFGIEFDKSFLGNKTKPAAVKLITSKGHILRYITPSRFFQKISWHSELKMPVPSSCMEASLIPDYLFYKANQQEVDEIINVVKRCRPKKTLKGDLVNPCNFEPFILEPAHENIRALSIRSCFTHGKLFSKKTGLSPIVLERNGDFCSWGEHMEPDVPWQMFSSRVIEGVPFNLVAGYIQNKRGNNVAV